MKVPVLHKIEFEQFDSGYLILQIERHGIGEAPYYWVSTIGHKKELENFLGNLQTIFDSLGINTRFPYPFYIVTDLMTSHPAFPILKTVNELPLLFKQKPRRLKNKEALLSNKCTLLAQKIENLGIEEKIRLIKLRATVNRRVHKMSEELQHIRNISVQLDTLRAEKKV